MSEIKQPEDHKKPELEYFNWRTPDGQTIRLKPFNRLPAGLFRKIKSMDEMESTFAVIEAGVDEAGLAIVDSLEMRHLETLFTDWAAAAGAEVPQS